MNRRPSMGRQRERYALATSIRHRSITRRRRPPVIIADPHIASIWPHSSRLWRPARTTWNGLRWVVARSWPRRFTGQRHPFIWRCAHLAWTVTALATNALAIAFTGAALLIWPAWWLTARLTGSALVLAGWTAPLTTRALINPDTATWCEPPPLTASTTGPVAPLAPDPWDWNTSNDQHLALQRETVAELRRANDIAARQHQQSAAHWTAGPVTAHRHPPPAQPTTVRTPTGRDAWWAAKSLLWLALLIGSLATLAAWVLAIASATGVISPPPPITTTPTAIAPPTTGANP